MKKSVLLSVLFIIQFQIFSQKKDDRGEIVSLICEETWRAGFDTIPVKDFLDSILVKYRFRISIIDNNTESSHYNPLSRTIFIFKPGGDYLNKLVGELPHVIQFGEAPIRSARMAIKGFWETTLHFIFGKKKYKNKAEELIWEKDCPKMVAYWWATYLGTQYDNPGRFENEAHYVIETQLRNALFYRLIRRDYITLGTE